MANKSDQLNALLSHQKTPSLQSCHTVALFQINGDADL